MMTRTVLIVLLFLSGCAAMPTQEQQFQERAAQVQWEQKKEQARIAAARRDAQQQREEEALATERERQWRLFERAADGVWAAINRGEILRSKGLAVIRALAHKHVAPLPPGADVGYLFAIAVAEQMEAGKLTRAEANYLVAKHNAEAEERAKNEEAAQEQAKQEERDRKMETVLRIEALKEQRRANEEQERYNEEAHNLNLLLLLNRQQTRPEPRPDLFPLSPQIHCTSHSYVPGTTTTDCD